jgi:hypothetical protein
MYSIVIIYNNYDLKLRRYFLTNYNNYFNLSGKNNTCRDFKNPILFLLNPIRRFKITINQLLFENKNLPFSSYEDFLKKKKDNDTELELFLANNKNLFNSQNSFIREKEYSKTIIVLIKDKCIKKLIDYLKIKSVNIEIEFSLQNKSKNILNNEVIKWLKNEYKEDFDLLSLVDNNPELFKKVIK